MQMDIPYHFVLKIGSADYLTQLVKVYTKYTDDRCKAFQFYLMHTQKRETALTFSVMLLQRDLPANISIICS